VVVRLEDLLRDGGELEALREAVGWSVCPEVGEGIEEIVGVQLAVILWARGAADLEMTLAGRTASASVHVAALGVERFLHAACLPRRTKR
jgi:hypothetical protein